ncbi:hypothetical protein CLOM_g21912 [Closterium sp. NIES-68]|nr:hypothetical protein CLOM_g21912 [Closterium sp. NIES-68]GJP63961.1 hypothetical protein CLOP_g20984 [Closterium sp. NIES-67]GJP68213.1 hypothetical protein CLOP_g24944 [Closterium sp. NIES-67]
MSSLVRVVSRAGRPSEKRYSLLDRLAGRDKPGRLGRTSSRGAAAQSAPGQQASKVARDLKEEEDDDDDSDDDEILSISSDEDDEGRPAAPAITPRVPAKWESSRMLTRMGTRRYGAMELGDGGEPTSWDEVGEDSLMRKVRDLRAALGGRANVRSQAVTQGSTDEPLGSTIMDPLGLGPLDVEHMCLQCRYEKGKSAPDRSLLPEMLVNLDEAFEPMLYLSVVHGGSAARELEEGREKLEEVMQREKEQLKKLVQNNFDCFISCKTTINDIERGLASMKRDCALDTLAAAIYNVDQHSKTAFGPLLERRAQVQRIQSVQGLLLRFRTLFNMPSAIRTHLRKHEYDSAVHEYLKAKSISLTGHSNILRRVNEEVEKVVDEFSSILYAQLSEPTAAPSTVENAIRLLLEIDPESDPIWHYVSMRERRIRGLLEACVQQHERRVQGIRRRRQEKREDEHQWRLLQRNPHEKLEPGLAAFLNGEVEEQEEAEDVLDGEEEEEILQQHSLLVCRLAAVLQEQLPQLWKVVLGIFTGKFANFSKEPQAAGAYPYGGAYAAKPPLARSSSGLSNQGGGAAGTGGPYRKHAQVEGVAMVMGIVGVFEKQVTDAFTALESSRELRPYMLQAVTAVAKASSAFAAAEAAPPLAVQALHQFRIAITARFVRQLCFIMRGAAADVAKQEDWMPAASHLTKGSEFDISHFPVRFGETIGAALDQITQALAQLSKDGPSIPVASGSDAAAAQAAAAAEVWRMYASVKTTFYESFVDACEALVQMAKQLPDGSAPPEGEEGAEGEEGEEEEGAEMGPQFEGLQQGVEVGNPHQRILMLLSNAGFCRSVVARDLAQRYQHLWNDPSASAPAPTRPGYTPPALNEVEQLLADVERVFLEAETAVGDQYIAAKAQHLGMAVIRYFLEDGTAWAAAPPVKGLRDSALDLILPLVAVHAEVSAGCSPFVDRAINTLSEGLMDALHQVAFQHADLEQLDANAFCQLSLELDYFQAVLQPFASPSLDDIIFQLRDMLLHRTMQSIAAAGPPPDDRPSYERQLSRGGGGMRSGEWGEERDIPTPQTPEQLKGIADSLSADLLPGELRRTRVNVFCFGLRLPDDSLHAASPSGGYDSSSIIHGAQSTISSSSGSSATRAYSAILPVPDTSAGLAARARAAGVASASAAAAAVAGGVGEGYRPGAAGAAAAAGAGAAGAGVGGTPRTAGLRGTYEGGGYGGGAGGGRGAYGTAAAGGAVGVGAGMYGGAAGGQAGAYGGAGGVGAAPYGGAAVPGSAARALDGRRGQQGARGYGGGY